MAEVKLKPVLSQKKIVLSKSGNKSERKSETKYRDGLENVERDRYDAKIALINGQDPYEIVTWSTDVNLLPDTTYINVLNYLVFTPSPYTAEDLQCYKGLDAYNQLVCGWVRDVVSCVINDRCVTTAKVLHSQRLNDAPLRPWVIAEKTGRVVSAHCTCMAGCGETCTHVAALLFYIETVVNIRNSKTVTEEKAWWKLPAAFQGASYSELQDIDFTSAKTMKKKLDASVADQPFSTPKPQTRKTVNPPNPDRLSSFFRELSVGPSKPAILSVIPEHSDKYVPTVLQGDFPKPLTSLRNENAMHMNYGDLLRECEQVDITVNEDQVKLVEAVTRDQAKSKVWHQYRSGRITASKMKAVCRTNPSSPAQSLITGICYPSSKRLETKATELGCSHETLARDMFFEKMSPLHENMRLEKCGLYISTDHPHIGASPDAVLSCDCCGKFTVEIKCPFCKKDAKLSEVSDKKFYLQKDSEGNLKLDPCHEYYYQVQTQLGVCGLEMAYFVVWTEKDLHVETIAFDEDFWVEMCTKSGHIFRTAILPELMGKFFSRQNSDLPNGEHVKQTNTKVTNAEVDVNETDKKTNCDNELWCYCREEEHGEMIGCDNDDCNIQWFHQSCLKIKNVPKGEWYCPDCRKTIMATKKQKKSGTKNN